MDGKALAAPAEERGVDRRGARRRPARSRRRTLGRVIIQLYTMQSVEEALACVDAGVDHLGLTPVEGPRARFPS